MSFPDDPLLISVQLFLLGEWVEFASVFAVVDDYYTDFYTDEYIGRILETIGRLPQQDISITVGGQDEASSVNPSSVSVLFWNHDGALTPNDPRSPYWPDIREGTLMRVLAEGHPRFYGEVASIAPGWPQGDLSLANPDDPGVSWVTITANGVFRRSGQSGQERSAMERAIEQHPEVTDAWLFEDGEHSTEASSALMTNQPAMRLTDVTLGSQSSVPGLSAMGRVEAEHTGFWESRTSITADDPWAVVGVFFLATAPESGQIVRILDVLTTGDPYRYVIDLDWNSGASRPRLLIQVFDRTGSVAYTTFDNDPTNMFGYPVMFNLTASQVGGNVVANFRWQAVPSNVSFGLTAMNVAGTIGVPSHVSGTTENCPSGGMWVGPIIVQSGLDITWIKTALRGNPNESAQTRIRRILREEDMDVELAATTSTSERMGPQPVSTAPDIVQECVTTDGGILREQLDSLDPHYLKRADRYNQPPTLILDAALSEFANPFDPVDDDQAVTNDVTAQRTGGASDRKRDQAHAERHGSASRPMWYPTTKTVNVATDSRLPSVAGEALHHGTWEGMRVPSISFEMSAVTDPTDLIERWVDTLIGDVIEVQNLPPQWPTFDGNLKLVMHGYTEVLTDRSWTVTANATPAGPWTVGIIEDDVLGRLDTDGSELTGAIDETETSIEVVNVFSDWTDADGPYDVYCDGEVWTVTAVSGTGTQTLTVIRSVNGIERSHPAGSAVNLAHPMILAR